jgi:hypothetical protein
MIIIEKYLEKSFIINIYVLSLPPVEQLECISTQLEPKLKSPI